MKQEMAVSGMHQMVEMEPHEALLMCVRIAAGEVAYCNQRIADVAVEDYVGKEILTTEEELSLTGDDDKPESFWDHKKVERETEAKVHIWIAVRIGATDRLARYSKMAIDAGVEERRIRLAERWGEDLAKVIRGILDDLRLSEEQIKRAPDIVRSHLVALETPKAVAA